MTTEMILPPALALILGGFILPIVRGWLRSSLVLLFPLIALWMVWHVPDGLGLTLPFLDYQLEIVKGDRLSRLFATIFSLMAFGGGLYALKQDKIIELSAAFIYAGSAVGVALAGDLITVFVFWEVMAIGSTLVVWSAGTRESEKSAFRYMQIHFLGGVILMIGLIGHISDVDSIAFGPMTDALDAGSPAVWLILIGFLINAGAPPLSAWIPDSYPEASWSGTVFLSAFTTKTAVYVLLRGFPGAEILIYLGIYMIFYGIIYALLENDMRRILSYSIVNQVGFMLVGVGVGTELAINGASAHAFTHIIYKALLLMSAGSVLMMTGGKRKCTDLGGLFQSMPITAICGIIGALAISSFPLTSGFISKSMTTQAVADQGMAFAWFFMAAASAGVFLHAGIKFPWFVFFQKDSGLRPTDPPKSMQAAMIFFAALCVGLGVYPDPLYAMLPYAVDYVPYTADHVVKMLQLLLFSGLAFFLLLPLMKRTLTLTLDVDWFYRKLGVKLAQAATRTISTAFQRLESRGHYHLNKAINLIFHHHGPNGVLARTPPIGTMISIMVALLLLYLILYFI